MPELEVGKPAKFSNYYLQILRGTYRKKAEGQVFEVIGLNLNSCDVRPWGSSQKYGPRYPRKYLVPAEVEVRADQDLYCRFCRLPINKDTPGAIPDIDPVTKEQSGYRHEGCQPDLHELDSSTPTSV